VLGARRFTGGSFTCEYGKSSSHLAQNFRVFGDGLGPVKTCPNGLSGVRMWNGEKEFEILLKPKSSLIFFIKGPSIEFISCKVIKIVILKMNLNKIVEVKQF